MTKKAADIAKEYFPDASEEELLQIIWKHTGFPKFWDIPNDGKDPEECFRTQLKRYKEEKSNES